MKKQAGFTVAEAFVVFIYCIVLPLAVIGWGWNIYKIIQSDFAQITGLLVVRVIGIFIPPIGAVLGYF